MVELFNTILQMSLNAAIVIIVVLIMRCLLWKAPKRFSYLLWAVVGFRLCCPISFSSRFSIFSLTQPDAPKLPNNGGDIVLNNSDLGGGVSALDRLAGTGDTAVEPIVQPTDWIDVFNTVVMIIWFIGAIVVLGYAFISYFKVRRMMSNAVLLEKNVYMSDRVGSPFTLGFIKPKIYIPFGLDGATCEQILEHERCHIRRLDHIVKPLAFLILAVHWFNPFCWVAFKLMSLDMELSCDENVLKRKGDEAMKKNYSRALLSFASNKRFPAPSPIAFSESNGNAKKRIKHALNFKKPRFYVNVICCLLCVFVLAACGADASIPEWQEVKTEVFGENPYNFVFVSNGNGSCYISEIRIDKDYDGTITLVIPEKAPNGDTVTEIRGCGFDGENAHKNLPVFISEDDFNGIIDYISSYGSENGGVRDSKTFASFYLLKNANGVNYFELEPLLSADERLRLSELLFKYGYDANDCYEFTNTFVESLDESKKKEMTRSAFKYLYLEGGKITEIQFPESVIKIGYGSFAGCGNLERVSGLRAECVIENHNEDGSWGLNTDLMVAMNNK